MKDPITEALLISNEKRILNEFASKILNEERLEKIFDLRKNARLEPHADTEVHCECDSKDCAEIILMSTEEYRHSHTKTKHFVVIPPHVRLDLEEIIASFNNYVLVAKFFPYKA